MAKETGLSPQGIICSIGTQSQKQCLKGTGTEIAVGILRSVFVYVLSLKLSTIQSDNSVQNALVFQPTKRFIFPPHSCNLAHNQTIELHHQKPWQVYLQASKHPKEQEKTSNGGAWMAGKNQPVPVQSEELGPNRAEPSSYSQQQGPLSVHLSSGEGSPFP